jgi:UDP-GlcNAc:undecaprenyl-phosphate GlcNAc-1-phosphate transferase
MFFLSTILLSVFITVSLIPVMTRLAERYQMVDLPNPRKVHTRPIPRIGGFAMALGAFVPVLLWAKTDDFMKAYLAGAGTLVLFGMVDDMKGLGYKAKFAGQFIAALIAVLLGGVRIQSLGNLLPGGMQVPDGVSFPLSVVAIVGVTNAINLSDGLDGLAGGISLLSFCCIGYLAYLGGNDAVMTLAIALAGAIFGFLRYNTHPASLFMGDTGSQVLGFSAVVLAVKITQGSSAFSPVLPLIILGFPVLDTLTVMVERVREGRSPFSPDKNHFHHRLMRLGLSHADAVFAIYVIQAAMIVSAVVFKYYSEWVLVASYALLSILVIGAFIVADRTGFTFKHYPLLDRLVKGRLRRIKDENWIIRISFPLAKTIIPLIFLSSCLLPADIPVYAAIMACCFCAYILLTCMMFLHGHMAFCLRFVLFLTIPLVLYLIEGGTAACINAPLLTLYNASFAVAALLVLLVMKYSRRTKGFRLTPMDFLIIFIAAVVPNLPDQVIQSHNLGLLTVKIIVMLFGYEVLIKELRGRFDALITSTVIGLLLIGVRGFLW